MAANLCNDSRLIYTVLFLTTFLYLYISTGICIDPVISNMTRVAHWVVHCTCSFFVLYGGSLLSQRGQQKIPLQAPEYIQIYIYIFNFIHFRLRLCYDNILQDRAPQGLGTSFPPPHKNLPDSSILYRFGKLSYIYHSLKQGYIIIYVYFYSGQSETKFTYIQVQLKSHDQLIMFQVPKEWRQSLKARSDASGQRPA